MKIVLLLAGLAICFLGCVHSRVLTNETPPDTLAQINRDFAGRSAQIKLESGDYVKARLVRLGENSVIFTPRSGTKPQAFPNADVESIIVHDRKRGLVEGLEYGAAIGAVVGAGCGLLVSTLSMSQPNDGPHHRSITPPEGLLGGAVAGAIPGAGLGMFMGGTGNGGSILEVRYRFPISKPRR